MSRICWRLCLLNYIARYDDTIVPYGKTGLLENSNKSNYSISKNVIDTFRDLIDKINTKYILLSYNNEGIMSSNTIKKILKKKAEQLCINMNIKNSNHNQNKMMKKFMNIYIYVKLE
jgi:adenine-specific DNA-methyltransferase